MVGVLIIVGPDLVHVAQLLINWLPVVKFVGGWLTNSIVGIHAITVGDSEIIFPRAVYAHLSWLDPALFPIIIILIAVNPTTNVINIIHVIRLIIVVDATHVIHVITIVVVVDFVHIVVVVAGWDVGAIWFVG